MKADMTSHRIERWPVLGCASALLALVAVSDCVGAIEPTGCTSIASVPVATISYGAAIQHGIFQDFTGVGQGGCADCQSACVSQDESQRALSAPRKRYGAATCTAARRLNCDTAESKPNPHVR